MVEVLAVGAQHQRAHTLADAGRNKRFLLFCQEDATGIEDQAAELVEDGLFHSCSAEIPPPPRSIAATAATPRPGARPRRGSGSARLRRRRAGVPGVAAPAGAAGDGAAA